MTITADYVLQGVDPQQIAKAPFDVQVVETANDSGVPFTAAEVKQMESDISTKPSPPASPSWQSNM
jgi:hypothetical protein